MQKVYSLLIILSVIILFFYWILKRVCHRTKVFIFDGELPGQTVTLISGTHGNEPAGSLYLNNLIRKLENKEMYLKSGKLIIIPEVNKCGLYLNFRNIPDFPGSWDINRNYPSKNSQAKTPSIILSYLNEINHSDFVLDFHEGWGFNRIDRDSLGSGIYASGFGGSTPLSSKMRDEINKTITNPLHKFVTTPGNDPFLTEGSLSYYSIENKIPYILIETSGQRNILPISTRLSQIDVIVKSILRETKMI